MEVNETHLPGVGVRYDVTTAAGDRVGVLIHRLGRRELLVYDRVDPDACVVTVRLDPDEARTLAEMFGAALVSSQVSAMQQRLEGLTIDWLPIDSSSPLAGCSLRDAAIHTRTGVSIVGVVRGDTTIPAPTADFCFETGDIAVSVGTAEGLEKLLVLVRAQR